ncbi:heme-binding protein [Halorussus salilacus]|uniref:SOUL family heme-binding protein n=1 Tax=Halorussus salilacus TaxID=2953750 RepID=UPI00209FE965|nr:heme-binding protein [Halorussus salilacus]USZ69489.1 heme-binding protein [Halorussus salilacus]
MRTRTKALLATAGGLLAAWVGWGLYVDRATERVSYEVRGRFDGVEVRRYPRTVLAETTAADDREAFGRLFRYISGENEGGEEVAMTAPVATGGEPTTEPGGPVRTGSEALPMTAPVRTESDETGVTMAFYLPADYAPETAPVPTNPAVRLVVEPPRTLAVRRFSWYATDDRVERHRRALLDALAERGVEPRGRPVLFQYDDPWTPPFMRRNEVGVGVDPDALGVETDAESRSDRGSVAE